MGKSRARKTRWRTLPIADDQSDSEDSNSNSAPKTYQQRSYYTKFTYSSQSTPRRRFQYDSLKSTRSSSTASENKITFNEDEYTRITTPRQDVLFKKGYLNKPKNYQTQTSTGTSITSTDNSTGNGTPDHQSADLEYESQFMFPNGFVDQNGIYYINSYEPYPLMLYNPSTYYQECSNYKSKRYSTGSLTESASPNNEEATSQDLSGGEASNNVSDYSGHHVYNMVVPGYYVNGMCPTEGETNGYCPSEPQKKLKKRRRRKTSKSQSHQDDSSEYTEDEDETSTQTASNTCEPTPGEDVASTIDPQEVKVTTEDCQEESEVVQNGNTDQKTDIPQNEQVEPSEDASKHPKYDLKPDAEEFVPRAFRESIPVPIKIYPTNFVPIPLMPMGEFNGHQALIPPGIPINFIPHAPNFVNYIPNHPTIDNTLVVQEVTEKPPAEETACAVEISQTEQSVTKTIQKTIDIATIVSKLEEAAKEQDENIQEKAVEENVANKSLKPNYRGRNNGFRRQNFNKARGYIQHNGVVQNGENSGRYNAGNAAETHQPHTAEPAEPCKNQKGDPENSRTSPGRKIWNPNPHQSGSPRRFNQYFNRSNTNSPVRTLERPGYKPKPNTKNYSEMLKKSQQYQNGHTDNYSRQNSREINTKPPAVPKEVKPEPLLVKPVAPTSPNQWISVASKKKRRNKNLEDTEIATEEILMEKEREKDPSEDQFESYDVNLLEDVVPPSKPEETIVAEVTVIEDILATIAQSETASLEPVEAVKMVEVTEIEKEIIVKLEESKQTEPEVIITVEETTVELKIDEVPTEETPVIEATKPKKKSKKGTQKPLTKRVIITDIDLSQKLESEPPSSVKKLDTKKPVEPKKPKQVAPKVETEEKPEPVKKTKEEPTEDTQELKEDLPAVEASVKVDPAVKVEEPKPEEQSEKKPKKKKKKSSKTSPTNTSLSSSSATLSNQDESYDFLLDGTLLNESVEKTNDEMSQELDKIIQKGMYNSLEVKIKSLNLEENDEFFRNFISSVPTPRDTRKTMDFSRIFQSTRHLLKPNSVSEGTSKVNVDVTKINLPDLESADESRILLEEEDYARQTITETQDKIYPITQAVKEWMSKTREATPEVEILKSPSTIYKEFCDSDSETVEDEVTLFSANSVVEVDSQDLMEYWEDDLEEKTDTRLCSEADGCVESRPKEEEEVLEVYESKYGQNEDFLKLQKEISESQKKSNNPRPGSLPHRAICCTLQ